MSHFTHCTEHVDNMCAQTLKISVLNYTFKAIQGQKPRFQMKTWPCSASAQKGSVSFKEMAQVISTVCVCVYVYGGVYIYRYRYKKVNIF